MVKIRITISFLIFILFIFLFLGSEKISIFLAPILLPLQFVPALLRVITSPSAIFICGLIFLVAVSLIFGRVYCSFLCPLGALQDFFIAISRKIGWQKKHVRQIPFNLLRYSLLVLTFIAALFGSLIILNLLDPFSTFGRIIIHLGEPPFLWIRTASTGILKYFDIYFFAKTASPIPLLDVAITVVFCALIGVMSFGYGRLYCNTICPVGALLGLIARFSLFKFAFTDSRCNGCGCCERVCKAGCIDAEKMNIDQSRCVNCFNCLAVCPQSAIRYRTSFSFGEKTQNEWSPERRCLIFGTIAVAGSVLLAVNTNMRNLAASRIIKDKNSPITPPGSLGVSHFTKACTACHLCVSVCPTKVIAPAIFAYGAAGFMQPEMDYEKSFCDYECNSCGKVCPTGAIRPLALEEKKLTQIGIVDLMKDKCIVYTKNENCGACLEVCPTHALYSINKKNVLYPETDAQYCIGCGACEKACPTDPKSIIINSNSIHQRAVKYISAPPAATPIQQKKQAEKDFPF